MIGRSFACLSNSLFFYVKKKQTESNPRTGMIGYNVYVAYTPDGVFGNDDDVPYYARVVLIHFNVILEIYSSCGSRFGKNLAIVGATVSY